MKRISPQTVIQKRPIHSELCISIYAESKDGLQRQTEMARLLAMKDHNQSTVDRSFKQLDLWLNGKASEKAEYPVAIFASEGFSGFVVIPEIAKPLTVAATSFHVKPMLKWLQREKSFVVLALEAEQARIFHGSLTRFKVIESIEKTPELSQTEFFERAAQVIENLVSSDKLDFVLAGPKNITDRFSAQIERGRVSPRAVAHFNKPEEESELHRAALLLLEPEMKKHEDSLIRSFWRAHQKGHTASGLEQLISLALDRRIKHLFVNERMNLWGQIDYRTGNFFFSREQVDAYDDCILDDLAELVLFHGGEVTVLPTERMPNHHAACAILRIERKARRGLDKYGSASLKSADQTWL